MSYFSLYYCKLAHVQPFALIILLAWLALLFSALGTVAGAFLAVNLGAVAQYLHMSDTLAGVTFLALGNGAPDIFSTIAAMNKSSSNLAIGELAGAAAFVTSVIPGSMALIHVFDVVKFPLIRDAVSLFITATFLLFILYDAHLRLWHCIVLLATYLCYITVVIGWHWWYLRKSSISKETYKATESTENGLPFQSGQETEPLLSQHHTHRTDVEGPDVSQPQQNPSRAAVRRSVVGARHESDTNRGDYRLAPGNAPGGLHCAHGPQGHTSTQPNATRCRDRIEHQNENSQATTVPSSRHQTAATIGNSKSRGENVFLRTFNEIFHMNDGKGRFGILFIVADVIMLPFNIVFRATIPCVTEEEEKFDAGEREQHTWAVADDDDDEKRFNKVCSRWLVYIQCFTSPQFTLWFVARQLSATAAEMFLPSMICLGASVALIIGAYFGRAFFAESRWDRLLCIPGFIVSIGWLSLLADEIVAVLKILGIILNVPDAIAGITIFAIGNSIDDLAANISVARHGHPVMALSACFGGPLLNILLGVGISGVTVMIRDAKATHEPTVISLNPNRSLFFVLGATMINLSLLLVLMVWTKWKMTRLVGFTITGFWVASTVLNVVLEVKG